VIFRGPHDRYEKLPTELWRNLPVCSVPPPRWPKLKDGGTKFSFSEERDYVKSKLRAALTMVVYNGYTRVVIGDFGLGNGYRNPPMELAQLWREIFLFDPGIAGRFEEVAFVFEDQSVSTMKLIQEDLSKKAHKHTKGGGKSKSSPSPSGINFGGSASLCETQFPTDFQIFARTFDADEIRGTQDPRNWFRTIMSPL